MAIDTTSARTRRAVLGAGLGAIAVTAASALGRPASTVAADGNNLVLGQGNNASSITQLTSSSTAFVGTSSSGLGVEGFSDSNTGVAGFSDTSDGMFAQSSGSGAGLRAESVSGPGVRGFSGPLGAGHAAPASTGVYGESASGRGGVFRGKKAQVQLRASTDSTHPSTGAKGDLFVDKNGRLWFCKGGTNWRQLA